MANINEQRAERQGFGKGGSKGKQGGFGSGKEVCSKDSVSKPGPNFKSGSEFVGQDLVGDLPVSGVNVVKGASAPSFAKEPKGDKNVGKGLGSPAKAPKAATEAGHS
jgi:hypothetical protein